MRKGFVLSALAVLFLRCPSGETGKVLKIPLANEPPTLDWNIATDNVSFRVITQIMEGLTRIDQKGVVRPALAERWEYYPDGPSYVFHLRKDVFWSDGVNFTSDQVSYSFRRLLSPETGSQYAYFAFDVKDARCFNQGKCSWRDVGVSTPDRYTVVFTLERPVVYFPYVPPFMVTFPMRRDLAEFAEENGFEPPFPVLGPFVPVGWRHHYRIALERNSMYHGKKPDVKRVEMFVVEEPLAGILLFEAGDLNMAGIFPLAYSRYRNDRRLREVTVFRGYYYGFNLRKYPVNHVSLRKALALAIDRKKVAESLMGTATPTSSWIPPGMPGYSSSTGLSYNPSRAREYLRRFYRETGKRVPEITIYFNATPENQIVAENVQHQWTEVLGIRVKLEMMEWNAYLQTLEEDPPPVFRLGWGADFPDPHNFMEIFTSWSGNNHTGWKNPLYDRLITEASRETDPEVREMIYRKAQKILLEEDAVIIPLFFSRAVYLTDPCWKNLEITSMDILDLRDVHYVCGR